MQECHPTNFYDNTGARRSENSKMSHCLKFVVRAPKLTTNKLPVTKSQLHNALLSDHHHRRGSANRTNDASMTDKIRGLETVRLLCTLPAFNACCILVGPFLRDHFTPATSDCTITQERISVARWCKSKEQAKDSKLLVLPIPKLNVVFALPLK